MKILIVLVRYRTPLEESPTVASLSASFREHPELVKSFRLLIWDNSPVAAERIQLDFPYSYFHAEKNLGVSGAYNSALTLAVREKCPWMLLLDQDTRINPRFLANILKYCHELDERHEIAAIVPTIRVRGRIVSPNQRLLGRTRAYDPVLVPCLAAGEASAINSGCVLRVAALQRLGGFSSNFWLDYSDLYVFHQLFIHGMKVWRAVDAELDHDLSLMDYANHMTPSRYANFTSAESAFCDLYYSPLENVLLTIRLLLRAIKHRIKYPQSVFSQMAFRQFGYRLRVSRSERVAQWTTNEHEAGLQIESTQKTENGCRELR